MLWSCLGAVCVVLVGMLCLPPNIKLERLDCARHGLHREEPKTKIVRNASSPLDFIVIGGGLSGVIVSKYLQGSGAYFVTLERRRATGGVWNFSDDEHVTTCSTFTLMTSSVLASAFSDFRPNSSQLWTEFLTHSEMAENIEAYIDHFHIRDRIMMGASVSNVRKQGGVWQVTYNMVDGRDQKQVTTYSRSLVVATGLNQQARHPLQDKYGQSFAGAFLAPKQVKNFSRFVDKRVLVVGGGETAADMAMLAATTAVSAAWAVPRGLHVFRRVRTRTALDSSMKETALDVHSGTALFFNPYPSAYADIRGALDLLVGTNGHNIDEWTTHGYLGRKFPIKNSEVLEFVTQGLITPYRNVTSIRNHTVTFSNGKEQDFDIIVDCQGYEKSEEYFEDSQYKFPKLRFDKMFRNFIHIDDPSLMYVGLVRPAIGSVPAIVELQSQYIVDLFTGVIGLPSKVEMQRAIKADEHYHSKGSAPLPHRPTIVEPVYYYQTLALDMGRHPLCHLQEFNETDKQTVLQAPVLAPGLWLWIGSDNVEKRGYVLETLRSAKSEFVYMKAFHFPVLSTLREATAKVITLVADLEVSLLGKNMLFFAPGKAFSILRRSVNDRIRKNMTRAPVNSPFITTAVRNGQAVLVLGAAHLQENADHVD